MARGLLVVAMLACLVRSVRADESGDSSPLDDRQKVVRELADRLVKSSRLSIGNDLPPLVHHGPLLRWSNPTVGEVHGEIHLWTIEGRPACLGSVYRWFTPQWGSTLELSSVIDQPLTGRQGELEFWRPAAAPIRWETFPATETPAVTAASRLIQMRRLARQFSARLEDTRQEEAAKPKAVERSLRLMPQPLFRHPEPSDAASYLDGALFTFVEGTDPEALILLEAVSRPEGPQWRYAVARMNRDAIKVSLGNSTVWSGDMLPMKAIYGVSAAPYALFAIDTPTSQVKP